MLSSIGFTCNLLGSRYIFDQVQIVSFLGALVIAILGNLWSRVAGGTALQATAPGILYLVPVRS